MAWDSVRGGLSLRERTRAREEYSFSVCFAFRSLRLGATTCLLGFCCCWCLVAIIGRQQKRRRRRGEVDATVARCRSMENDDANDMEKLEMEKMNHCMELKLILCYGVIHFWGHSLLESIFCYGVIHFWCHSLFAILFFKLFIESMTKFSHYSGHQCHHVFRILDIYTNTSLKQLPTTSSCQGLCWELVEFLPLFLSLLFQYFDKKVS